MRLRAFAVGVLLLPGLAHAHALTRRIPVFARQYRTTCTTCHVAPPKLNALGEAFRLNGYRFPQTSRLIKQEQPIPLGDEAWKDEWPRAIWPGELSGTPGISLRVQSDIEVRRDSPAAYAWTYRFPSDVYLLGAASLGDGLATFVEAEWSPEAGARVLQAKVTLQDPFSSLPRHLLGVWFGLQGLYPMQFTDRQLDRPGRQLFGWQSFAMSDVQVRRPGVASPSRSGSDFRWVAAQPAIEVEGVAAGRLGYGLGLAQGGSPSGTDRNNHKDRYARLRLKIGGYRLDGEQGSGQTAASSWRGQLRDRTLHLEGFGYQGAEPNGFGEQDSYWRAGIGARAEAAGVDAGVGVSWGRHRAPWGAGSEGKLHSTFAKVEYMPLPWAIASLKAERLQFEARLPGGWSIADGDPDRVAIMPGVILLARPNARLVLEGELFARHRSSAQRGAARPHALWVRTDFTF